MFERVHHLRHAGSTARVSSPTGLNDGPHPNRNERRPRDGNVAVLDDALQFTSEGKT